ncbi:MAG TPA: hypothetical protein VEC06_02500 [Paucimonas sp.]|nr:hypothetical protein [Paucimonas sp.]
MKRMLSRQGEINWYEWNKIGSVSIGYIPLTHTADGFYSYADVFCSNEWALISAVRLHLSSSGASAFLANPKESNNA